jgi:hypothetical protein
MRIAMNSKLRLAIIAGLAGAATLAQAATPAPTPAPTAPTAAAEEPVAAFKADTTVRKETFTAMASVKTAGGTDRSAPVTIRIFGRTSQDQRDQLIKALQSDGTPGVRKLLSTFPDVATIEVGKGSSPLKYCWIQDIGGGMRLITLGADHPLFFLGADAKVDKPKEGYDVAVIDLQVDGGGKGDGTLSAAAKLKLADNGGLRVEDYSVNLIRLDSIQKKAE